LDGTVVCEHVMMRFAAAPRARAEVITPAVLSLASLGAIVGIAASTGGLAWAVAAGVVTMGALTYSWLSDVTGYQVQPGPVVIVERRGRCSQAFRVIDAHGFGDVEALRRRMRGSSPLVTGSGAWEAGRLVTGEAAPAGHRTMLRTSTLRADASFVRVEAPGATVLLSPADQPGLLAAIRHARG
jgi:hypothetical protein